MYFARLAPRHALAYALESVTYAEAHGYVRAAGYEPDEWEIDRGLI